MSHVFGGSVFFFFFKQKTAYEIVSGDWSSDVCSSDLNAAGRRRPREARARAGHGGGPGRLSSRPARDGEAPARERGGGGHGPARGDARHPRLAQAAAGLPGGRVRAGGAGGGRR